jgi:alkylated DNA repair dioxygenase AlkB
MSDMERDGVHGSTVAEGVPGLGSVVPGLTLVAGYADAAEQESLVSAVDASPWQGELKRRVQHYGFRYDYRSRSVGRENYLGDLPVWVASLQQRLAEETTLDRPADQLIVNEYLPGQGISPHVDCVPCFGPVVLSLSLGSGCTMTFSDPDRRTKVDVWLEPGMLVSMSGEARYRWLHSISPRKSDVVQGERVSRGRRVSLTFRTVVR